MAPGERALARSIIGAAARAFLPEVGVKTETIAAIALGAALCVPAAGGAWGQMPGGQGGRGGRGGQPQGPAPSAETRGPAQIQVNPDELARSQLQDFDDDLNLAPTQRVAWKAYSSKILQLADDVGRNRNALRFPKGTAPEQLEFVAQVLRNRLTAVEDIVDAGKALYAVLTPAQREIADARLARIAVPLIAPAQAAMMASGRARPPAGSPPEGAR